MRNELWDNMNQYTKAFLSLILGLAFMCFSAVLIKASTAPGLVTVFYRMSIGSLVLAVPFLIHKKRKPQIFSKRALGLAAIAGVFFALDMLCWSTAVVASNATIPTIMANLAPVWVGLGSVFLFKEKKNHGFWVGLAIALVGIIVMVFFEPNSSNRIVYGIVLGFLAGVFYACFYLVTQKGRKLLSALSYLFVSTTCSALVLSVLVIISGVPVLGYGLNTTLVFLAIGIGVQVFGWFFISYAQGYIKASVVAPTLLGQPVLTAVLAALLLNEQLTAWQISGGVLVIFGIYMVHFYRLK